MSIRPFYYPAMHSYNINNISPNNRFHSIFVARFKVGEEGLGHYNILYFSDAQIKLNYMYIWESPTCL